MSRGTFALTLLLAAAAGASWYWFSGDGAGGPARTAIESADLGYYLTDVRLLGLDADGHAFYTLLAERVEQRPEDGSVSFRRVTLDYDTGSETPWLAEANLARLPAGGESIELEGDVRLTRRGGAGRAPLTITTSRLDLAVHERVARTPAPVDLTQGGDTLSATGLEADLRNERLRLLAGVRLRAGTS